MKRMLMTSAALAMLATPALAQEDVPVMERDPNAVDVAKTPVTDLNIDKKKIPEILREAERQPYTLKGLSTCTRLVAEVRKLDKVLGPDIDLPVAERDQIRAGPVSKTVVESIIPFRGLIRQVSGASAQERMYQAAIDSGLARRGFLKGVGQTKGCAYPARPASQEMILAKVAEIKAKREAEEAKKKKNKSDD